MHGGDRDPDVVLPVRAQTHSRRRLALEIELRLDALHQLVGELPRADPAGGLDPAFERPRDEAEHRPVALNHLLHARPLDLDHHRVPAVQLRSVGLPDRRRRERLEFELVERLDDRLAELGLEHLLELGRRHALDVGVQVRELVGDRRWQQVGAGGGDLAELHEHPARALEHYPQPARKVGGVERRDRPVTDVDEVLLAGVADQLAKATDG